MKNIFEKLDKLSQKRIEYFLKNWDNWYKGSENYWVEIQNEIEEAKNELDTSYILLEDELWDILWDYLCLLHSLEKEWKITSLEKVFERAYKKYSWRINIETWENNWDWKKVKELQKQELKKEIDENNLET